MAQAPSTFNSSARDTGQEVPFDLLELIYSRTDTRGVICAANDTFDRLAGYGWRDTIGAPHKLVRHSDMPKGFFHIFWSLLKSGVPAVGYVKNRNKDGRYYWVLAAAIPCEGVFLGSTQAQFGPVPNHPRRIRAPSAARAERITVG
ncbi:PAS domain-containing protein [Pararhodobacter zhoushanensis]|uniref:PAS domain-containing protein n=1 Tax=Pararhodobacter zhoushanensis TaxID=2479545 RepID=A0ABT3H3G5_9RHOB|nr:PAS domain-containing protein [Pararhodobacter zhoushanensis]MCW1934377.1 PAS domain-containing protein [Pararhodobacter zhoushanensis]